MEMSLANAFKITFKVKRKVVHMNLKHQVLSLMMTCRYKMNYSRRCLLIVECYFFASFGNAKSIICIDYSIVCNSCSSFCI